eukprot:Tbor_TRINITY_DN3553_c0_g1::TRINITY_DN3553_c0_g1_i1::g.2891::m.2891
MTTFSQMERFGKARISCNRTSGLSVTPVGVSPSATHVGVDRRDAGDFIGLRHLVPKPSLDDSSPSRSGKRNIVPLPHACYGDAGRRELGKIGVRNWTKPTSDLWYDNDIVPPKNYANTKGISALTTDQLTKRFLHAAAAKDPKVEQELAILRGSGLPIERIQWNEDRILRSQRAEERKKDFPTRQVPPKRRCDTLGVSTANPPFAINEKNVPPHIRHSKRFNIAPMDNNYEKSAREVSHGKRAVHRDPEAGKGIPFATATDGIYPDPPSVGHSVTNKRNMVRHRHDINYSLGHDADTVNLQKAMSKFACGGNVDSSFPQFIFGDIPPPEVHKSLLRERYVRMSEELNSQTVVRGKRRLCGDRSTALW